MIKRFDLAMTIHPVYEDLLLLGCLETAKNC